MSAASLLVSVFYLYIGIGILFAIWFVLTGVNRIDNGVKHAPWGVRVLIFPGSVLLWIVLLLKCLKAK